MNPGNAQRWRRTKAAFQKALALAPTERAELLDRIQRDDTAVARDVNAMLAAHDGSAGFLSRPFLPAAGTSEIDVWIGVVLEGKYRIEERTGRGGMGAVYRATHLWTGRTVAVKIIAPEFMANSEFVERFKGEARAAGSLRHPNVVNVTDFGLIDEKGNKTAYLVMEFLDGATLAETLRADSTLPISTVVDVLEQLALAVDEAHAHGILHRDIKPSNIWLSPDGRGGVTVKVLDFGLAKLREGHFPNTHPVQPGPSSALAAATRVDPGFDAGSNSLVRSKVLDVHTPAEQLEDGTAISERRQTQREIDPRTVGYGLTRAGAVLGTPAYMSPEQWQARPLTPASDIYGLGVVAYEMLAGEPPFTGEPDVLCVKHTEMSVPSLRIKRPEVSRELERLVANALSKSPMDRPVSARIFAAAFRTIAEGEPALVDRARESESIAVSLTTDALRALLLATGSLLIVSLVRPWALTLGGSGVLQFALWMAPLAMFLAAIDVAAAARLCAGGKVTGLGRLLAVSAMIVRPAAILGVQVLATTASTARESLHRSGELVAPVPSFARAAFLRRLLAGLLTLLAGLVAFAAGSAITSDQIQGNAIGFGMAFIATCLVSTFFAAREGAARARLFRIASSLHDSVSAERFLKAERPSALPFRHRPGHALTLTAALVAALLMLGTVHVLFVPPFGPGPSIPQPSADLVPREENAWTEYHLAFEAAGFAATGMDRTDDISSRPGDRSSQVERLVEFQSLAGFGDWRFPKLTDEQRALVLANEKAVDHLRRGALLSRSQFSVKPANVSPYGRVHFPVIPMLAVTRLAMARARMLIEEGLASEGAAVYLAAYSASTRFSDPSTGLAGATYSLSCRRMVAWSILGWAGSGKVDPKLAREVLVEIERLDSIIPSPVDIAAAGRIQVLRSIEEDESDPFLRLLDYTPGLRERIRRAYADRSSVIQARLEPYLQSWDIDGFETKARELYREGVGDWPTSLAEGALAMHMLFFLPEESSRGIESFAYADRFLNAGARAMLIADMYRSIHGRFPDRIEDAAAVLGVSLPVDVATGSAVDYRLIDGVPVVRASESDILLKYGEPYTPKVNAYWAD